MFVNTLAVQICNALLFHFPVLVRSDDAVGPPLTPCHTRFISFFWWAQNLVWGNRMTQEWVDLSSWEDGVIGSGRETSHLCQSSTKKTSASASERIFFNRSEPNVGFWNKALHLMWSATSKITLHQAITGWWELECGHIQPHCPWEGLIPFITTYFH